MPPPATVHNGCHTHVLRAIVLANTLRQECTMRRDIIHPSARRRSGATAMLVLVVVGLLLLAIGGPFRTVPAGHVGVKDRFVWSEGALLGRARQDRQRKLHAVPA